jgi:low affinity Fe/Cu permease
MKKQKTAFKKNSFESFASMATKATGSTPAFIVACTIIIAWVITGPLFNYSDTWQLVINTGTTIITFLMVFLIQKTQNKDAIVVQVKLNELLAADPWASNRIVNIEDLTEEELILLHNFYAQLSQMAKNDTNLRSSHSIEEARNKHQIKKKKSSPGGHGHRHMRKPAAQTHKQSNNLAVANNPKTSGKEKKDS